MKTILKSFPILLLALLCGCDNDETPVEKELAKLHYSFSIDDPRTTVSYGDLLTVAVGTTFFIYTDSDYDYDSVSTFLEASEHIRITPVSAQVYACTALQTGQAYLFFMAGRDYVGTEDILLYIDIEPTTLSYVLLNNSSQQVIDIANDALHEKIEQELSETYALPASLSRLTFTYLYVEENLYNPSIYTRQGTFVWMHHITEEVLAEGHFTKNNPNTIDLFCDDQTAYSFTSWATDTEGQFIWKLDLTEIFREKYPTEVIHEVSLNPSAHQLYY